MINSDKKDFEKMMLGCGEIYDKKISPALMKIYFASFEDFTIDQVQKAFSLHVRSPGKESTFFPKPADLIRKLEGSEEEKKQNLEFEAEQAWNEVYEKIQSVGSYGSLKLENKKSLAAVKAIGGWNYLSMRTYQELIWDKKEFISAYERFEKTDLEKLPSSLPGLIEQSENRLSEKRGLQSISAQLSEYQKKNGELPSNVSLIAPKTPQKEEKKEKITIPTGS